MTGAAFSVGFVFLLVCIIVALYAFGGRPAAAELGRIPAYQCRAAVIEKRELTNSGSMLPWRSLVFYDDFFVIRGFHPLVLHYGNIDLMTGSESNYASDIKLRFGDHGIICTIRIWCGD